VVAVEVEAGVVVVVGAVVEVEAGVVVVVVVEAEVGLEAWVEADSAASGGRPDRLYSGRACWMELEPGRYQPEPGVVQPEPGVVQLGRGRDVLQSFLSRPFRL
jgi:hypothetical protein